jgi:uncharacterized protein
MKPFHIMAKPHGPICNLDCTYCYYLEKEQLYAKSGRDFRMNDSVLEAYIRQYIEAQPAGQVSFAWQGGEPTLLGVPFFERVVELQQQYANGKTVDNAFQTNGTLLDDEWGEFLARNKFLIGTSVDGPEEIHDAYRVDKGGQPTFARVMRGLGVLKKHGVEFNTLTVVNRKNSYYPRDTYRFLKEIGSRYLQFIPVVEQIAEQPDHSGLVLIKPYSQQKATVSEWSVEALQFGRFLIGVFDEWVLSDVGRVFVQIFDVGRWPWSITAMFTPAITSYIRRIAWATLWIAPSAPWCNRRSSRVLGKQSRWRCLQIARNATYGSHAMESARNTDS